MTPKYLNTVSFVAEAYSGTTIIDVRSPAEFASGHIPGAKNMPLFSNEERAEVGIIYKRVGKREAIERGLDIVGPKMSAMTRQAAEWAGDSEKILVYCWRGGMRSGSVAWLLGQVGLSVCVLTGGYKAYRSTGRELISQIYDLRLLGGYTGSGKTEILHKMAAKGAQVIDLEGLAAHRGSAFGSLGQTAQPSTEHLENLITHELYTLDLDKPIWVEAESRSIGTAMIPDILFEMMNQAALYRLEIPFEVRLDRIMVDYGGFSKEELSVSMEKVRKRIGFDKCKEAMEAIEAGDIRCAAAIGLEYYDKGYNMSLQRRNGRSVIIESEDCDCNRLAEAIISM